MEDKKSIAVIGEREFTVGFELAGIQKTYGKDNYREKIQELIQSDELGIVVAEKSDIEELPERIRNDVNESVNPVVVALSEKAEDSQLQDKIRKVIGIDLS
ncbi:MAG: V-type ATP synthase subunit F [Nanohaloarchaea archaeon SW_10_44_10]|nr:MAG: V-type ATP synthase subunit F [Nanohaloarchaea archaeon SW_10_44_10]